MNPVRSYCGNTKKSYIHTYASTYIHTYIYMWNTFAWHLELKIVQNADRKKWLCVYSRHLWATANTRIPLRLRLWQGVQEPASLRTAPAEEARLCNPGKSNPMLSLSRRRVRVQRGTARAAAPPLSDPSHGEEILLQLLQAQIHNGSPIPETPVRSADVRVPQLPQALQCVEPTKSACQALHQKHCSRAVPRLHRRGKNR